MIINMKWIALSQLWAILISRFLLTLRVQHLRKEVTKRHNTLTLYRLKVTNGALRGLPNVCQQQQQRRHMTQIVWVIFLCSINYTVQNVLSDFYQFTVTGQFTHLWKTKREKTLKQCIKIIVTQKLLFICFKTSKFIKIWAYE